MEYSGFILYVLLFAILFLLRRNAPCLSLDKLLKNDTKAHHRAIHVIAKYPKGTTWKQSKKTMDEVK